jgi:thiol-disulfide isomerase/thioredoxin
MKASVVFLMVSAALAQQSQSPFQSVPTGPVDALTFRIPVGNFVAADIHGRTWRRSDLLGKFTVVDIWGIWCMPCQQEHPALQSFHEKSRAIANVQVLTLALGSNPTLIEQYMKERNYSFPVISGGQLVSLVAPLDGAIPTHVIIDPQGRRSEPFREWTVGRILMEVEKAAAKQ